jgi:hypothetical protein
MPASRGGLRKAGATTPRRRASAVIVRTAAAKRTADDCIHHIIAGAYDTPAGCLTPFVGFDPMTATSIATPPAALVGRPERPGLNPAQRGTYDRLRGAGCDRPAFAAGIGPQLRAAVEEAVEPLAPRLADLGYTAERPLRVGKHQLASVHGCEARFVAEATSGFTGWTPSTARGTVAHKAVELLVHWRGEPVPLQLVDEAMARLAGSERSLGEWLASAPSAERAELRAFATDRVTKFLECFPPLHPRWRPVTEAVLRVDLAGGAVVMKGKVDLTIGFPRGDTPMKVLVDFKTGGPAVHHLDDLRFYALLETIRLGVPPVRLVTYYLDQGIGRVETVTEGLLAAALARTTDGIRSMLDLRPGGRDPLVRAGPACRWCPLQEGCQVGIEHLGSLEDRW